MGIERSVRIRSTASWSSKSNASRPFEAERQRKPRVERTFSIKIRFETSFSTISMVGWCVPAVAPDGVGMFICILLTSFLYSATFCSYLRLCRLKQITGVFHSLEGENGDPLKL